MANNQDAVLAKMWQRVYNKCRSIAREEAQRLFGPNLRGGALSGTVITGTGSVAPTVVASAPAVGQTLTTTTVAGVKTTAWSGPAVTASAPSGFQATQALTVTTTTAVSGSTTTPVPTTSTDYVVRVHLTSTAAAAVYAGLAYSDGSDLCVFWNNSGTQVQLDVDIEAVSSSVISLWFKLQANIGSSSTDTNYTLAYGNTHPFVLQDKGNIYPFYDDFLGTTLDLTKWFVWNGTITTVSAGVLTIEWSDPANHSQSPVHTLTKWGNAYVARGRGSMPFSGSGQQRFCLHNGDADEQSGPRHQSVLMVSDGWTTSGTPNTSGDYAVMSFNDTGSWGVATPSLISADSSYHVFNIGRDSSGYAYGWIDEGAASTTTLDPVSLPGWVYMSPYGGSASGYHAAGSPTQSWDWVKVRPFVPAEPVVTLAAVDLTWGTSLELTDGTTDLTGVKKITTTGLTVGGTSSAATLVPAVMGASGGSHAAGTAPDPGSTSGTTRFLREDATWAAPPGGVYVPLSNGNPAAPLLLNGASGGIVMSRVG